MWTLAQATVAREFIDIENVCDGLRTSTIFGVRCKDNRPDDVADTTFIGQRVFDEIISRRHTIITRGQHGLVDHFKVTFGAGTLKVDHLYVHHIPKDISGFHLGFHFGHAAAVVFKQHVHASFIHKRLDHMFHLRGAVRPTKRSHCQILGHQGAGSQRRGGQ